MSELWEKVLGLLHLSRAQTASAPAAPAGSLRVNFLADFRCSACGARLYDFGGSEPYLQHPGGADDAPSSCRFAGQRFARPMLTLTPET